MSKFSKVGVLIAALALCGLLASSASAAEWHTNGPLTRSSTEAGASRLVIHPSSGAASLGIGCTSSTGHVALNGPTSTLFPWTNAATVTPYFNNCSAGGGTGFTVRCAPAELRAISYIGGTTLASAGTGVTTGAVTNINCRIAIGTSECVTVTGSVHGHYINPTSIAAGAGRLTITSTGQALVAAQTGASPCALIPPGTATFGSPGATATTITDLTYTVDGPNAPYIFRTP